MSFFFFFSSLTNENKKKLTFIPFFLSLKTTPTSNLLLFSPGGSRTRSPT